MISNRWRFFAWSLVSLTILAAAPAFAEDDQPKLANLIAAVEPSVVTVEIPSADAGDGFVFNGSGFVVSADGIIATC